MNVGSMNVGCLNVGFPRTDGLQVVVKSAGRRARNRWGYLLSGLLICGLVGCERTSPEFQPNLVFMRNQKLVEDIEDFDSPEIQQHISDIHDAVTLLFGTADAPRIPQREDGPEPFHSEWLEVAAGPYRERSDGTEVGLFRHHCVECHGVTGDGQGRRAVDLDPYPRDYRRGIFKFKTTPVTLPPTREDLAGVLQRGVPGTAMPAFDLLPDSEREALVEYVRYLSVRGMFERLLITEVAMELDFDERLFDISLRDESPAAYQAQEQLLYELLEMVLEPWLNASQNVSVVPPRPANWESTDSIAYGRQLFFFTITNCAECHGNLALGDGITDDYDEWTKELDPDNPAVVADYLALGALPPRHSIPRDLREGIYRGGASAEAQFLRIRNGIAGTTMPSISTQLGDDEIWHLVAHARSLHGDAREAARRAETSAMQPATGPLPQARGTGAETSFSTIISRVLNASF